MRKIAGPGALAGGVFTEGNPATGQPATVVTAQWLQDVQDELINAVLAAGLAPGASNDQLAQAIRALASGSGGGSGDKNLLINGDFGIQQRGTLGVLQSAFGALAVTNSAAYTLDRWVARADAQGAGSGTATIARIAHTFAQTAVPGNPQHFARYIQTANASNGQPMLAQRVEDVTRFGEGVLTFSVYLRSSVSLSCQLRIVQNFGTGGSPSSEVVVATAAAGVGSGAFTRYTVSVDLTAAGYSMAGKTLGSSGASHLRCEILMPQGATFTLEASDAQLERSISATPFARRSPGAELALCRRYFERTSYETFPGGGANAGAAYAQAAQLAQHVMPLQRNFLVAKYRKPTMTWFSPVGLAADAVRWGSGDIAVTSTADASETSTGYPNTATVGPAGTNLVYAHWQADAEIV